MFSFEGDVFSFGPNVFQFLAECVQFSAARVPPHGPLRQAQGRFCGDAGVSVLAVKGFQAAGAGSSIHGVPRRATALRCSRSLRITATRATLPGFPRCRRH